MYAVGFVNGGKLGMYNPCGNNGLQKLHNKTLRGWNNETKIMQNNVDEVFIVNDFTQKMCEMSSNKLYEYCWTHKVAVLSKYRPL